MIGNGVVIDPRGADRGARGLRAAASTSPGLRISANAHLIMPYHVMLDTAGEAKLGKLEIGTTRRGIGPCYADKAGAPGDPGPGPARRRRSCARRSWRRWSRSSSCCARSPSDPKLDLHAMTEEYLTYGHRLEPHIADTARLCWEALDSGRTVIFEGAQATLLDLDHGTYPFVTSSNPIAGAACVGAGVGPADIDEVWGVAKAYATRVGAGPVPDRARRRGRRPGCRERGDEFGTTTGRQRRCGWLDLVALRYAVRLNRMSALAITKLDVLAGIDPLRVASATAAARGRGLRRVSPTTSRSCTPPSAEYEELPGFEERDRARPHASPTCRAEARDYLAAISDYAGVPIRLVGVGPGREQVIWIGRHLPARRSRRPLAGCRGDRRPRAAPGAARPGAAGRSA